MRRTFMMKSDFGDSYAANKNLNVSLMNLEDKKEIYRLNKNKSGIYR